MNKLRVAAYCRVSTNHEQQESSLETQISCYGKLIAEHENRQLVKIYAERASGTQINKRPEFMKMIKACRPDLNEVYEPLWQKHVGHVKNVI